MQRSGWLSLVGSAAEALQSVKTISADAEGTPEAQASELRHHLRNRFAAIRNAAFYIEQKTLGVEVLEQDPRIRRFFELISRQLEEADEVLTLQLTVENLSMGGAGPDD
ncbi:MAG: hypothetical protein HRU17_17195 [Polyangiaceae bacterium]|nr:hypothetical protein [Polyangiaceae bacterium]